MRILGDLKYIILNHFVNKIPFWHIRKFLYKLCGLKIGKGSRIALGTVVIWPKNIFIGNRVVVNENCVLDGRGGIKIGDDVSISMYVKLITGSHLLNSDSFEYISEKIIIGNNCWLGCSAIVLNGSELRDKSVVGAGTVFKGIAEEDTVYIGNPAKAIKKRSIDSSYQLNYNPYFR